MESTLLHSITKATIDSKIINPITESDKLLYRGADDKLLWERLNQHFEETKHDHASLLQILTTIQAMSKHPSKSAMTYLHHFTIAVNKLRSSVKPGEAIQVPPTHMLAYYLIDGL
eukprot:3089414-Ditylum_brightwellii.AAC.1